jgi:hypothetical protein
VGHPAHQRPCRAENAGQNTEHAYSMASCSVCTILLHHEIDTSTRKSIAVIVGQAATAAAYVGCPAYSFAMRRSCYSQLQVSGSPLHLLKHGKVGCYR